MKGVLLLVAGLLCLGIFRVDAQQELVDSLEQLIGEKGGKNVQSLNDLAFACLDVDPDKSIHYAQRALKIAKEQQEIKNMMEAANITARAYLIKNQLDSAKIHIDNILNEINMNDYPVESATLYLSKGAAFYYGSDFLKAANCFENSAKLYAQAGDTVSEEAALLNMATVLMAKEEFDKPRAVFNKLTQSIDPQVQQKAYSNLGSIAGFEGKNEESLSYFEKGIAISKKNGFDQTELKLNLAITHEKLGNYDNAIQLYQEVKATYVQLGAERLIGKTAYNLGYLYTQKGRYKDALTEIEQAEKHLDESNTQEWLELFNIKHMVLSQLGQHKNAYETLNNTYLLRDSLFNTERTAAIAEIETKYQTEKKEAEIKLLQQESALQNAQLERQNIILIAILLGLVLLGVISILLYLQNKDRKRSNQLLTDKNEKIELLHRELSHRVKNNMAFVSSLMRMQARRAESKEAKLAVKESEARIEAMALLHRKLYLQDTSEVEASAYLKELCTYLQHSFPSHEKTPAININVDQLLMNGEDAMRLGLIINELVTNSFKYAFSDIEQPQVDITLSTGTNGAYQLLYKDNGKGLPSALEMEQKNSMGLKLIHTLTQQLDGQLSQYNDGGACFRLDFERPQIAI
jgi:two-component sensor histidine kinase